jgi:hypothetical protein
MTEEEKKAEAAAAEKKKADEEAEKALDTRIGKIVNSAITTHMKRQPAGLDEERLTKILDERETKRAELEEEKRKAAAAGGSGKGGADNQPEIAALKKQIEALTKKAEAAEAKSTEQEKKQQEASDKESILKTLEAAGVSEAHRARAAMNHLRAEGKIKRTDEGLVGIDKDGDEQDLADTITEFLKSEEGKLFLPPSEARGGGSPHKRGGGEIKNPKNSKERAGAALRSFRSGSSG